MKRLFAVALVAAFVTAGSLAAVAAEPPVTVVLEAKNGNITFNHKAHSEKLECKTCHGEGTPAKIELDKDKAHALCKDCHQTKGAGPTKCGDCHKK